MKRILISATIAFCITANVAIAQVTKASENNIELSVLAGMIQPFLLKGGNVEVDLYTKKMVFEYSHGFSLEMTEKDGTIPTPAKKQGLAYHLPYSIGFGIGYRLNKYFDVRFEPKLHRFEVYYEDAAIADKDLVQYTTATLGIGAYFRWKPFERKDNFLKGLTIATSVRYWQNVYSTLKNDKFQYYNELTEKNETLRASNIGIAGSPIVVNVSIGYTINLP